MWWHIFDLFKVGTLLSPLVLDRDWGLYPKEFNQTVQRRSKGAGSVIPISTDRKYLWDRGDVKSIKSPVKPIGTSFPLQGAPVVSPIKSHDAPPLHHFGW